MCMKQLSYIKYATFLFLLAAAPALTQAQTPDDNKSKDKKENKSVIKINKLDVIYEDEEYSGIVIDQKATTPDDESYMYEKPFIIAPPPPEDPEVDEQPKLFQSIDDEGAESEDDIIYAGFDSEAIHYPKLDVSNMAPLTIQLVNHEKKQEFCFPTPDLARATSHFGPRRRRFHYGVDLAMPTGEPIYAAFDGTVRISKFNKTYGNLIVIRHHNGLETYYAHLSRRIVESGDVVKAGETIGLCGNTGRSYGSHLHFEIRYMGNAMNPENVIDCSQKDLISETLVLNSSSFRKVAKAGATNASAATGTYSSKGGQYYKVRSGDTLSKIAKRNGTTVRKLCQLNGIKETTVLSIGRRLRIR